MRLFLVFVLMLVGRPDIPKSFFDYSGNATQELPDSARDNTDSDEVSEIEIHETLLFTPHSLNDHFAHSTTQSPLGKLHSYRDSYIPKFNVPPSLS